MSMKNKTIIVYSNKEIDESVFDKNFEKLRYISPKFFNGVKDVKICSAVYTNKEDIANAYAVKGIPQHPTSPLYGKVEEPEVEAEPARVVSDEEFENLFGEDVEVFDDSVQADEEKDIETETESETDSEDTTEESVEDIVEEAFLSDEEILELPFFTMKSEIKKKYGTSPKNKKEAFSILGVEDK